MPASSDRVLLWGCLGYAGLLTLGAALLPYGWVKPWLSETGPFEAAALAGWVVAAAVLTFRIRPFTSRTLAFVVICLVCAAREADLHKAFTHGSISRLSYYRRAAAPFAEKLVAGALVLVIIGLLLYAAVVAAHFLFREGGLRSRSGLWLTVGAALFVLTSVLDRYAAVLARIFGLALSPALLQVVNALEEGLEALMPLAFALSAWISQKEGRYLS